MKYTVLMSCGHEETIDLVGKNSERERKLNISRHMVCVKNVIKGLWLKNR